MVHTPHVDRSYERDLNELVALVSRMGLHARGMVRDAIESVARRDEALARDVVARDQALDELELQCDRKCVAVMARRAPVGGDLRYVTGVLKIVTDLERIGDLAVNLARRGRQMGDLELPPGVLALADTIEVELDHALSALAGRDGALARELAREDASADQQNRACIESLIASARAGAHSFERLLAVTSACRYLERIGDHSVNIAETVVFIACGDVVRHSARG